MRGRTRLIAAALGLAALSTGAPAWAAAPPGLPREGVNLAGQPLLSGNGARLYYQSETGSDTRSIDASGRARPEGYLPGFIRTSPLDSGQAVTVSDDNRYLVYSTWKINPKTLRTQWSWWMQDRTQRTVIALNPETPRVVRSHASGGDAWWKISGDGTRLMLAAGRPGPGIWTARVSSAGVIGPTKQVPNVGSCDFASQKKQRLCDLVGGFRPSYWSNPGAVKINHDGSQVAYVGTMEKVPSQSQTVKFGCLNTTTVFVVSTKSGATRQMAPTPTAENIADREHPFYVCDGGLSPVMTAGTGQLNSDAWYLNPSFTRWSAIGYTESKSLLGTRVRFSGSGRVGYWGKLRNWKLDADTPTTIRSITPDLRRVVLSTTSQPSRLMLCTSDARLQCTRRQLKSPNRVLVTPDGSWLYQFSPGRMTRSRW